MSGKTPQLVTALSFFIEIPLFYFSRIRRIYFSGVNTCSPLPVLSP